MINGEYYSPNIKNYVDDIEPPNKFRKISEDKRIAIVSDQKTQEDPAANDLSEYVSKLALCLKSHLDPFFKHFKLDQFRKTDLISEICNEVLLFRISGLQDIRVSKTQKKLPATFYLKNDSQNLWIQIYGPKKEAFQGSGTFKTVKKTLTLKIPLVLVKDTPPENMGLPIQTVLQRSKKGSNDDKLDSIYAGAMSAIHIKEKIHQQNSHVNFPIFLSYHEYEIKESRIEIGMAWYNGDLYQLCQNDKLPLDMYGIKERNSFDLREKLKVLIDAGKTLKALHQIGFIHLDVKPQNILIHLRENQINGFLSDYDNTINQPGQIINSNLLYEYYNVCAQNRLLLVGVDMFAFAMTIAETFLPNFWDIKSRVLLDQIRLASFFELMVLKKWIPVEFKNEMLIEINRLKHPYNSYSDLADSFRKYLEKMIDRETTKEKIVAIRKFKIEIDVCVFAFNLFKFHADLSQEQFARINADLKKRLFDKEKCAEAFEELLKLYKNDVNMDQMLLELQIIQQKVDAAYDRLDA
jgi:hypothetical protein